jgi:putative endonuclease
MSTVARTASRGAKVEPGLTSDVSRRHAKHDTGGCTHTVKHRPWSVDVVIGFADERRAVAVERHLKSGSGVAFASAI